MTAKQVNQLIRKRRSIFPKMYIPNKEIPKEIIQEILENANWAPTHRLTEPWRFKVFTGDSRKRLSEYLGKYYENHTPPEKYSEMKHKKTLQKPLQSACVIAICMKRCAKESVPEEEEIASVAMAVQNMWLSCTAYEIGCYWSSPKSMSNANDFLGLEEGERCLGILYMGYHNGIELQGKRQAIAEKVEWM